MINLLKGGLSLPVLIGVLGAGGVLGWGANSLVAGGSYEDLARTNLRQSQEYLNRTAWVENRAAVMMQLHAYQAYQAMKTADEMAGLVADVANLKDEGRQAALDRAAALAADNADLQRSYEIILDELDELKRGNGDVEEYLNTKVPDPVRQLSVGDIVPEHAAAGADGPD